MKKKFIIIALAILLIIGIVYFCLKNKNFEKEEEYTPEQEISDEQLRQTIVSLYFQDNKTNELVAEGRLIDAKQLLSNPYKILMELLINGPKNEKMKNVIPNGTKLNNIELKKDILYIDLSKEFIDNHPGGELAESNTVYSIVNTMTKLTEVNGIKILVDGKTDKGFKDGKIKFDDVFIRKENT